MSMYIPSLFSPSPSPPFPPPLPSLPLCSPPLPSPPLCSPPPDNSDYEGFSVYDIADMIKLYFRELPEPLLTAKFSEILIVIHESECVHSSPCLIPKPVWEQDYTSYSRHMRIEIKEVCYELHLHE